MFKNLAFKYGILKIVVLVLCFNTSALSAQKTYAKVDLDGNEFEVNEQFSITYALVKEGQQFTSSPKLEEPTFGSEFNLMGKSNANKSFNLNGKITSEIGVMYYASISKPGTYTVPKATFILNGKTYSSQTKTIKILKPTTNNNIAGDLILKLKPNKNSAYVGESIKLDLIYYSAFNTNGFQLSELPKFNGFVTKTIQSKQHQKIRTINGKKYITAKVASFVLTPIKTGKLKIPSIKGNISLVDRRSFFPREVQKEIQSGISYLNIKPLPTPKPKDFSGLVGDFKVEYKVDKTSLPVNDAVTINITVNGTGNLENLNDLNFELPNGLEALPPTQKNNYKTGLAGTTGSKTFEYIVIPRNPGTFKLPDLSLSFFNTKTKKYTTINKKGKVIEASGNAVTNNGIINNPKSVVQIRNNDIRYLQDIEELTPAKKSFFTNSIFHYLTIIFLIIGFPVLHLVFKPQKKSIFKIKTENKAKANKIAKSYLKDAKNNIEGDKNKFYDAVDEAMNKYLLNKLMIDQTDLALHQIKTILNEKGVDESTINKTIEVFNNCKMGRFSPIGKNTKEIYDSAINIINELENQIN